MTTQLSSVTSERAPLVDNETFTPQEEITKEGHWFLPNNTPGNSLDESNNIEGQKEVNFTPHEEITKEGSWFLPDKSFNHTLEESEDWKGGKMVNLTPKEEITKEGPWFLPNKPLGHTLEESEDAEGDEDSNLEEREVDSDEPYQGLKAEYGGWSPPENNMGAQAAFNFWCMMLLL